MIPACTLTFGTTAIGFGSLLTASGAAVRDFAVQAFVGLGCLLAATLLVFGGFLRFFRPPRVAAPSRTGADAARDRRRGAGTVSGWLAAQVTRLAHRTAVRHPRVTLAAGGVLVAGCLALAAGLRVNSNMLETYAPEHPAARTVRLIERDLGGVIGLEVILGSDRRDRLFEPRVFAAAMAFERFARGQPEVTSVRGYVDLYQRTYAVFRRDRSLLDEPPVGEEGEARLRLARSFVDATRDASHPEAFLAPDGRTARILVRVGDVGTARTLDLMDRLSRELDRQFPATSGVTWHLTGDAVVNSVGMDRFVRDFFWSLVGAVGLMFGVIALLFRSVRAGLIALIPNVAPLVLTLGYIRLRGFDLNAGNVIVFAVGLGIAVDDTIHFLARFLEELGEHPAEHTRAAVLHTVEHTGRAIVLTTVLILLGLSVLMFSDFLPTVRFAELTCVTLGAALLGDLFLLPAGLVLFWRAGE